MKEDLKPFLDEAFSKRPDVIYVEGFIAEITKLPIPESSSVYRNDIIDRRRTRSRNYLLERCDCYPEHGICIKHGAPGDLAINVALIYPESTLYIFENFDTFLDLREYYRENRLISINTSSVSHIKSEVGKTSKVSTIYLTDDKIA